MFGAILIVFVLGYALIAMEHRAAVNKSATALCLGTVMWVLASRYIPGSENLIAEKLGEVSEILFFLMGAMTIVELVDIHGGFRIITDRITTTKKSSLFWIVGLLTFFLSAVLDNLTTSIVIVALLRKLIADRRDRWVFAGLVIIAANSGGAWSPIGDVTTIMLWIAGKFTASHIVAETILPGIVSVVVPVVLLSLMDRGRVGRPVGSADGASRVDLSAREELAVLAMGVGALLSVPVFKAVTGLPPYMGMLLALAALWAITGHMHRGKDTEDSDYLSVNNVLKRIDVPSILFFLGILMAVNALDVCGHLTFLSQGMEAIPLGEPDKYYLITILIGLVSAVVDNVPLVAAAMGMYSSEMFPTNHYFWEFLAYTAGTGGSILIIGSAAGVAVMGMEKIEFFWYLKRISWIAAAGFFAGAAVYMLQNSLFG